MTHRTTLVTLTYGDRFNYLHTLVSRSLESPLIERVIMSVTLRSRRCRI